MKKFVILFLSLCLSSCSPTLLPSKKNKTLKQQEHLATLAKEKIKVDHIADDDEGSSDLPYLPLPQIEPEFDVLHYQISLQFPDESLKTPFFDGEVQITLKPNKHSFQLLKLDSSNLNIKNVTLLNTFEKLRFEQRESEVWIDLNNQYTPEDTLMVSVQYRWEKNPNRGVYFRSRHGIDDIETIYSQSEPDYSKHWFPANGHPNDRATFEAYITVPKDFFALSNGALLNTTEENGLRTFHWSQQIPMVTYLFVVTAGKFGIYEENWKNIPVQYLGPNDDIERVKYSLRNTPKMLSFFSDRIGLKYPYEKYAQTVVPQYMWGGMEHTTATTLTDRTVHSQKESTDFSSDDLVSHEMAHQWFGDLITCKNWDHLWLNEGFATFFNALYQEYAQGKNVYLNNLIGESEWYFAEEDNTARPVVFSYYQESPDYFFDSHAYAKGAYVLHMLRQYLGDQIFFEGVKHYVLKHQNTLVETKDFQKVMERVSNQNLEWFFDQWLYKPGYPKFTVSYKYDETSRKLALDIKQTQDTTKPGGIFGTVPIFKGKMPVEIDGSIFNLDISQAQETYELYIDKTPSYVNFNFENAWLAKTITQQSENAWHAQLKNSLDPVGRKKAAGELSKIANPTTLEVRASAILECGLKDFNYLVRANCITALQPVAKETLQKEQFFEKFISLSGDPEWEVRAAFYAQSVILQEKAIPLLKKAFKEEKVLSALVSAILSTGKLKVKESYDLLMSLLGRKSYQNRIQEAVLESLAYLNELRSFETAVEFSASIYEDRIRQGAFKLLASLGLEHKEQVSENARLALESALYDKSYQIRKAAIKALGQLKNKAAILALQKVAETDPDDRLRMLAKDTIRLLNTA